MWENCVYRPFDCSVLHCRGWRDDIPELQEDYGGVQQAELFLCADVLASNLIVEEVANESLRCKIRVSTRNGKEYDVENQCWPQL